MSTRYLLKKLLKVTIPNGYAEGPALSAIEGSQLVDKKWDQIIINESSHQFQLPG